MSFCGTVTKRAYRKKSKAHKRIQNDAMLRSEFFLRKTSSVTVPRFEVFFSGFTDKSSQVIQRMDDLQLF